MNTKIKNKKFPSKEKILDTLLNEDPNQKDMEKLILLVEHKKIDNEIGFIRAELLKDGKAIIKGGMTTLQKKTEDSFDWTILKEGQSYFEGYFLDYRGETFGSIFKEGLKKAVKEGKIPFFPK